MKRFDSLARNISIGTLGMRNYWVRRPFSISFEVTHSCNAKCKHCHIRGKIKGEKLAPPERFGEICREVQPVVAQMSGGEPLLRRDLEDIARAFRIPNRAPLIAVTTNASLLSMKRYTSLRQAGIDEFSVSLDYPDERHDEFRGIKGLFGKIGNLVKELRNHSDKGLLFCCVIQKDNFRELPRIAELATEWQVKVNFSPYTNMRTQDDTYMLDPDEVDELEDVMQRLTAHREKHMNVMTSPYAFSNMLQYFRNRRFPNCLTGWKFCNVNPDGTFSPCGLIIKDYRSREELIEKFSKSNTCEMCYTSIRANCEKPFSRMLLDNLQTARMRAKAGSGEK